MARNNRDQGWKLVVRKNTRYSDKVQLNNFNVYLKQTPKPPTSKRSELNLVRMEHGVMSLFECKLGVVMNHVEGMMRGYRKEWLKKEYVDIHSECVVKKNYDPQDVYQLYSWTTYKSKVSNLVCAWNRKLSEVYTLKQKKGEINPADPHDHWNNPPFIRWTDCETFSCKKVMFVYVFLD